METTCFSTAYGCTAADAAALQARTAGQLGLVASSRSEANIANASIERYCASSSFRVPETFFMALVCGATNTETEMPTSTAGRWLALNRSDCRKIWPSVWR